MKTLTTILALTILATPAFAASHSSGGSHSSHSSGVRAVHSYVRPTSAQARVHAPKLAPTAMHKASTLIPYIAPHYTSVPASAPTASAPASVASNLGSIVSVSKSSSVSSTGASHKTITIKGTNGTLKLTRSVSKTGVVTYKRTFTAATPKAPATPKASTAAKASRGGSKAKAPKEPKAAATPASAPAKPVAASPTGGTNIVSAKIRCANGVLYDNDAPAGEHCRR
jgi:hypothetical protein